MRKLILTSLSASLLFLQAAHADITVGFTTSSSGTGATIGRAYRAGLDAAVAYLGSVSGQKIKVVILDDASDQSTAARDARKLIDDDKVDILMGTSGIPGSLAMAAVASEKKVPMIALTPAVPPQSPDQWIVTVPQSNPLMVAALVDHMKATGIKRVAFIGFSDALGDDVLKAMTTLGGQAGIEVVTDERYARADTSVAGQVLKVIASRPDAVLTGGSGTAGALPYIALAQRGFKKPIYGTHPLINPDFIRVGGAAVQGTIVPTGPVVVAEQLPDDSPTKKMDLAFRAAYQKVNGQEPTDALSPYAFDAWLIMADAAKRAIDAGGKPGTEEFRTKLRDAILSTKELVGTHGIYNFYPGRFDGLDERARVLVKLDGNNWKLLPN